MVSGITPEWRTVWVGIRSELPVAIPNLLVQNHILALLDNLRKETQRLESIYQQKLDALDALKKSLLDQAFTGAL